MTKRITVLAPISAPGYKADAMTIAIDAAGLATRVAAAVAAHHRQAIRGGNKASGGPQRALGPKEKSRAAQGKRDDDRGMGSKGRFPASIAATKGRGDTKSAASVAASDFFDDWQEREQSRGVDYFDTEGEVDALVNAAIDADLKRQGFS